MDEPKERPKILLLGDGSRHQWLHDRLLAMDFADIEMRCLNDMVIQGTGFQRVFFDEHLMPVKEHISSMAMYDWKQEAADGLHRRKEPKGPRGRWGKL